MRWKRRLFEPTKTPAPIVEQSATCGVVSGSVIDVLRLIQDPYMLSLRGPVHRKHGFDTQLLGGDCLGRGKRRQHRKIAQGLPVLHEADRDDRQIRGSALNWWSSPLRLRPRVGEQRANEILGFL